MFYSKKPKQIYSYFNQNWHEQIVGSTIRVLTPAIDTKSFSLQHMLGQQLTKSAEYFRNLDKRLNLLILPSEFYNVAVFDQDSYWQRFVEKANREGFDPEPWYWSEGDIDGLYSDTVGSIFCLNFDKCITNESVMPSDIKRFILHELDHLWLNNRVDPQVWPSIFEREGLAEAEARIGFDLQGKPDMQFSTDFLLSSDTQLVAPNEIIEQGYNHPSFAGKVSESSGYASCFLWYFGVTLRLSDHSDLMARFNEGNSIVLKIANESKSRENYIDLFHSELGINYSNMLETTDLMTQAQQALRR